MQFKEVIEAEKRQLANSGQPDELTALCLSGGGIRSASFNLGVLQGLARYKVLRSFDYLSTVSGGGYIGAWLSAWIQRSIEKKDPKSVVDQLGESSQRGNLPTETEEPDEIKWLRKYSNYLSPRLGFLSPDSWGLAATVLRNMVLNWLLFIPLIAVALMLPGLFLAPANVRASDSLLNAVLIIGFTLAALGIGYARLDLPSVGCGKRSGRWFLGLCLLPLVLATALGALYWIWYQNSNREPPSALHFILFFTALHFVAWAWSFLVCLWRNVKKEVTQELKAVLLVLGTGASGGWLVWLIATLVFSDLLLIFNPVLVRNKIFVSFSVPALLTVLMVGVTLYVGLSSSWTKEQDREWWSRSGAFFLMAVLGWTAFFTLALFGPLLMLRIPDWVKLSGGLVGVISGIISALSGLKGSQLGNEGIGKTVASMIRSLLPKAAAIVFIVVLLIAIVLATDLVIQKLPAWITTLFGIVVELSWVKWVVLLSLTAIIFAFGWTVDINKFSLHSMYGNRIVRTFLGASNRDRKKGAHPFTGFDPGDNLRMHKLKNQKPFHIINATLNLVKGKELAWQERKATSFTISPLHSGSWYKVGYRDSYEYGGPDGISLGRAVAVSGAAASPNMGYYSSPLVSFLMTLFNARLGWWLGNPCKEKYRRPGPRCAVLWMIREALGLTNKDTDFIYLSDGGHFDNLGLYEMVKRQCRLVVVSDASRDPKGEFSDLGNAIRKIRVDQGVRITLNRSDLERMREGYEGEQPIHCCTGIIHYSEKTKGRLIYIKAHLTGDEPVDLLNYKVTHTDFPHESTADQWYGESQFESYRCLGLHTVRSVFEMLELEDYRKKYPSGSGESRSQFIVDAVSRYVESPRTVQEVINDRT